MKEKINYFKELSKTVILNKTQNISQIEKINDVLFVNKITYKNLQDHKAIIYDLLNVINEKKDQIYLITTEKELLEKDLNFWVYGFDSLKVNKRIREKLKELNMEQMAKNINEEMSHKKFLFFYLFKIF